MLFKKTADTGSRVPHTTISGRLHTKGLNGRQGGSWLVLDCWAWPHQSQVRQTGLRPCRSLLLSWTRLLLLYLPITPKSSYSSWAGRSARTILCSAHLTHWSSRASYSTFFKFFLHLCELQRDALEQLSSWYPLLCSSVPRGQPEVISFLLSVFWCCFEVMVPKDLIHSFWRVPICFINFEQIQRCRETSLMSMAAKY